jgi:hypothetical protein
MRPRDALDDHARERSDADFATQNGRRRAGGLRKIP